MSEYKGIKGFQVQTRTEDPVPYAQALADNPYAGTWSSGGDMNQARQAMLGGGSRTSNIQAGGTNPSTGYPDNCEEYDGSSWSEIAEMNQARGFSGGSGANAEAVLIFGGRHPSGGDDYNNSELWNGSSWSETHELNTGRSRGAGAGIVSTAALLMGGRTDPPPSLQSEVESYNGSAWSEIAELNTDRINAAAFGTTTSAVIGTGGTSPPDQAGTTNAESWNGSSWTEVGEVNTARIELGGSGSSNTAGLIFAGFSSPPDTHHALTEDWNGTAWTEVNDMATGRASVGDSSVTGTTSALVCAGYTGTAYVASTEEWAFTGLDPSTTPAADYADAITGDFYYNSTTGQFKTVNTGGAPIGTWASGGDLNTGRNAGTGTGISTAALSNGGAQTTYHAETEQYDGSSWTEVGDLN